MVDEKGVGARLRPNSSAMTQSSRYPNPAPPYGSGMAVPTQPISPMPRHSSASYGAAPSRMRRTRAEEACSARNFRAWSRSDRWSGEKSKFTARGSYGNRRRDASGPCAIGHEKTMGGARLRLRTNAETGLGEKPAPVIRRVLVVNGEEPETPVVDLRGTLLQHVAPPREIGGQRAADPIVEQQETGGGENPPYLGQHGQRLVDHVQHRRHAEQVHTVRRVGKRLRRHVVHGEDRRGAREGELPAMAHHGGGDIVPMEPPLRESGAQIAQQEAGAAAQIHDDRLPREGGGDLRGEELPEGRPEALRVRRQHPLEQLIVRSTAQRLVGRHSSPRLSMRRLYQSQYGLETEGRRPRGEAA